MLSNVWTTLIDMLHSVPSETLAATLGALVISPLLQLIKTWWERKDTHQFKAWVAWLFIALVSTGSVFAEFVLTYDGNDAGVIWIRSAIMMIMTQPVYFLLVKPIVWGVTKIFSDVDKRDEALHSAIVPPEGIPLEGAQPVVRDLL